MRGQESEKRAARNNPTWEALIYKWHLRCKEQLVLHGEIREGDLER